MIVKACRDAHVFSFQSREVAHDRDVAFHINMVSGSTLQLCGATCAYVAPHRWTVRSEASQSVPFLVSRLTFTLLTGDVELMVLNFQSKVRSGLDTTRRDLSRWSSIRSTRHDHATTWRSSLEEGEAGRLIAAFFLSLGIAVL